MCCGLRGKLSAFYRVFAGLRTLRACITFVKKKCRIIIIIIMHEYTSWLNLSIDDRRPQRGRRVDSEHAIVVRRSLSSRRRHAIARATICERWSLSCNWVAYGQNECRVFNSALLLLIFYYDYYYASFTPIKIIVCPPWNARVGMCRRFSSYGWLTC